MRKFDARWWDGPELQQWRFMVATGDYFGPFAFWPFHHSAEGHQLLGFKPAPSWMEW